MIVIHPGMPSLQFVFSVSVIHFPLPELGRQGTATLSDGVLSIAGELQICSQSFHVRDVIITWKLSLKIRQSSKVVDHFLTNLPL
jgi:hypothetical protein